MRVGVKKSIDKSYIFVTGKVSDMGFGMAEGPPESQNGSPLAAQSDERDVCPSKKHKSGA